MKLQWKPILRVLLILFVLYAIFTSPQQSADTVHQIWDILKSGVQNLANFFSALLKR